MNCPNCGGEMWDNTKDKKNPKGPDYKCKDKNCIDPHSGMTTAIWLPKGAKIVESLKVPAPSLTMNGHNEDLKAKAMILAYAKDLVVAQMQSGNSPGNPVKETIAIFLEIWQAYKEA
jgi:hypothetical protein